MNIWRTHPEGVRIVKAEKTLNGTAHPGGVKFCGPFANANSAGFWVFPAQDVDILWKGGHDFEYNLLSEYNNAEHFLIRNLLKEGETDLNKWCPEGGGRTKYSWGAVEEGVVQIYTGVILETPPGWCLHVRSPVNFEPRGFHIMEGIVPTDWMQYDLWTNLKFDRPGEWVHIRKDDWPPLAQLIPVRRESIEEDWQVGTDQVLHRTTPEANRVFEYFVEYNNKKYCSGGKQRLSATDPSMTKDATTYHKERMKMVGNNRAEPHPEKLVAKKFHKPKRVGRFVKRPVR